MILKEKHTELLINSGFEEKQIQQNWLNLENAYSKKSRHYHNLTHINDMITCYESYLNELEFPNEVLYAIFYHDYIYNSRKKDNELKSAEYAVKILPKDSSLNSKIIYEIICATKDHQFNGIKDVKWLIDFDLKILSRDWKGYKVYFELIRKEYSIYPDFLYIPGRIKALNHFLENDFIFQTEEFRNLYESKARENIKMEIDFLSK